MLLQARLNKIIVKIFPVFNKTLQSITKIWEKVVDNMMIQCTSSQFGFMSTTDAIFTPKQTIEKDREGQTNIRVTFLGIEKAFDRIPREELWRFSRERNVPESTLG